MNVKNPNQNKTKTRNLQKILINNILMFGLVFTAFILGIFAYNSGFIWEIRRIQEGKGIKEVIRITSNYIRSFKSNPERLIIDIKYKDFQKITYKRKKALLKGILITDSSDFVPAKIRYQDKTFKIKIRLKGDWTYDHLGGDKWSFRIKLKDKNTLFGMKKFSIHHPKARNYVYEWIFHQVCKREGIIALRYKFIDVVLNGKDLGIYALEEHFDKRLIEHNQLKEGPIVRYNENLLWKQNLSILRANDDLSPDEQFKILNNSTSIINSFYTSTINAHTLNKTLNTPLLRKEYLTAVGLLERLRNEEIPFSKAIDIKKWARYFALIDLLQASHAIYWHNLKFYYNPVTGLLEPIAFDGNSSDKIINMLYIGEKWSDKSISSRLPFLKSYDNELFREYVNELERISKPSYLDALFLEIEDELHENLNILYREFPDLRLFRKDIFYDSQKLIRNTLNPPNNILKANTSKVSKNRIDLEISSTHCFPVEILGIYLDSLFFFPAEKIILAGTPRKKPVINYKLVSFILSKDLGKKNGKIRTKTKIKLSYRILGTSQKRYIYVPYDKGAF